MSSTALVTFSSFPFTTTEKVVKSLLNSTSMETPNSEHKELRVKFFGPATCKAKVFHVLAVFVRNLFRTEF
jgi:hypothetical protein